jgi:hypothetical protein
MSQNSVSYRLDKKSTSFLVTAKKYCSVRIEIDKTFVEKRKGYRVSYIIDCNMVTTKTKYSTVGILVLFLGLFSVVSVSDSLFAQGSNQSAGNQTGGNRTAGNQTGEAMQTAGNQTGEALQTAGNQTGEALQTAGNQTGEALQTAGNQTGEVVQTVGNKTGEGLQAVANETGKALKGAQEFFNEGGQNQGQ